MAFRNASFEGGETTLRVIHDRCIQYPCRSMSVVIPTATLVFGAAK